MSSPRKIFGTDGVRGTANIEPVTAETALKLGRAAAHVFKNLETRARGHARHKIVLGKDTRLSGYMLENAISSGILSMGVDVLFIGPLPTPDEVGKAVRIDDALGRYIEQAKASFPRGMTLEGLRLVVDCAHGAAYKSTPCVLRELGAEV